MPSCEADTFDSFSAGDPDRTPDTSPLGPAWNVADLERRACASPTEPQARRRRTRVPEVGQLLGRCRLLDRIGAGGSAVVFRAHHESLDVPVALKVLTTAEGSAMAATEARLLARLDHPNIVRVLDADLDGSVPFLVLELVEGPTLHDVIRARGPLPWPVVARLGAEVADALEHALSQGILHRDLKPSNILLGRDGRARVADLGIAARLDDAAAVEEAEVVGTLDYIAPERLRPGAYHPDGRADVWSLGVVLYEALTGRTPRHATSVLEMLQAIDEQPEARPAQQAAPLVDPRLSQLVQALLDVDVARRPARPAQVAAALRSLLAAPEGAAPAAPVDAGDERRRTWWDAVLDLFGSRREPTFAGSLERIDLPTVVHLLHASDKTGQLFVHHDGGVSRVDVHHGEVCDVRAAGGADPETSFHALSRLASGRFEFYDGKVKTDSGRVRTPTESLLRSARAANQADEPAQGGRAQRLDGWQSGRAQRPDAAGRTRRASSGRTPRGESAS